VSQFRNITAHLYEIDEQKPTELIVRQIRSLVDTGVLSPGDKLPSERLLAQRFGVGRGYVRNALKILESYGILKTEPHRGSYLCERRDHRGLVDNVLRPERGDIPSITESYRILLRAATGLAAERANAEERAANAGTIRDCIDPSDDPARALDRYTALHRTLARSSKNSIVTAMLVFLSGEILVLMKKDRARRGGPCVFPSGPLQRLEKAMREGNRHEAEEALSAHLHDFLKPLEDTIGRGEPFPSHS
jgi:GntR family transcriptional repressor for pyruvate dehydrogenase complex